MLADARAGNAPAAPGKHWPLAAVAWPAMPLPPLNANVAGSVVGRPGRGERGQAQREPDRRHIHRGRGGVACRPAGMARIRPHLGAQGRRGEIVATHPHRTARAQSACAVAAVRVRGMAVDPVGAAGHAVGRAGALTARLAALTIGCRVAPGVGASYSCDNRMRSPRRGAARRGAVGALTRNRSRHILKAPASQSDRRAAGALHAGIGEPYPANAFAHPRLPSNPAAPSRFAAV
ncbi:hypothetical protein [Lysobacter sp. yr284]|uniref:hypothetical protein n=1 Tax=Lysobacter sp. yr284 TaxID=1761791 RepID=UPI0011136D70|nr:hypothetical protein [Lysobacter sp. yr284]